MHITFQLFCIRDIFNITTEIYFICALRFPVNEDSTVYLYKRAPIHTLGSNMRFKTLGRQNSLRSELCPKPKTNVNTLPTLYAYIHT